MIGEKTKEEAKRLMIALIDTHWNEIRQAYQRAEKGLTVGLSIGLEDEHGRIHVMAGINFVAERVKNQVDSLVDEVQEPLFRGAEKGRKTATIDGQA